MKISEMEEQIKILDERTRQIDQILRTLATKDDLKEALKAYATKEDLKAYATKENLDLAILALQHEMTGLATKADLNSLGAAIAAQIQRLGDRIELLARPRRPKR